MKNVAGRFVLVFAALVVSQAALAAHTFSTVDAVGNEGGVSSLALNGSNPVIAYYDATNTALKLATCTANCSSAAPTWQIVTVDDAGQVGQNPALMLNGGNPVISYFDATNNAIKLATCTAGCQGPAPTWQIVTVESVDGVRTASALQLAGGNPVVAFVRAVALSDELRIATCTANCASASPTWRSASIDSSFMIALSREGLQLDGANPVIGYGTLFGSTGKSRLATCTAGCQGFGPTYLRVDADTFTSIGPPGVSLRLNGAGLVMTASRPASIGTKLLTCTANCKSAAPTWVESYINPTSASVGLEVVGGNPVVFYSELDSPNSVVAFCTAACQTASPTWKGVSVGGVNRFGSAMKLLGGVPYATYVEGAGPRAAGLAILDPSLVVRYSAPVPTGTGTFRARMSGGGGSCALGLAQLIPAEGHPASPPAGTAPPGVVFPHGLFDFTTTGCTPGSSIALDLRYPEERPLPPGAQYWKYGPTPGNATPHWYEMPSTVTPTQALFTITDGGLGDDDLTANGTIVDQGGPGAPGTVGAIPTLSQWALMILASLMLIATGIAMARRRA